MNYPILENVDLLETMEEILNLNTQEYRSDFCYDVEHLLENVRESDTGGNYLWISTESGTQLLPERELFIPNNSVPETFKVCTQGNEYPLVFLVEPTERVGDKILGRLTGLNPESYLATMVQRSQEANQVLLSFPNHEQPVSFSYKEFDQFYSKIQKEYGYYSGKQLIVPQENQLQESMKMTRNDIYQSGITMEVGEYLEELSAQREADYQEQTNDSDEEFLR